MLRPRIIPILLLSQGNRLVKTVEFAKGKYVGDPSNAIKIFNEKEVDEIIVLDIEASKNSRKPNIEYLHDLASECFMPLCYGGGINNLETIKAILSVGVEKVSLNHILIKDGSFLKEAAQRFGSSTIVASVDVKKDFWGKHKVYDAVKGKNTAIDAIEFVARIAHEGAGEILLNCVDRDGRMEGYDYELITHLSKTINIPLVACGGAGNIQDCNLAINAGAAAAAAGSIFVFIGKHKAVLINYPSRS